VPDFVALISCPLISIKGAISAEDAVLAGPSLRERERERERGRERESQRERGRERE
jgi:hypothetical protein